MMYKNHAPHLHIRDGVYYFVRRVPIDVQIGGWSTAGVGQAYGEGYTLDKKWDWLIFLEY